MFSYSHAGRHTFRGMGAFFDSKSGLVLGFNLGPKKGPQIETLPYLSRGRGPVSGTVLGPCFGSANLCRAGPKFWPESGPCFTLSENHFCDFGASRRVTIASVSFLATCYWVNALACKAGGDNPTVEAPRHEAGFSRDFRAPKRRPANGLRRRKHGPSRVPKNFHPK